MNLKKENNQSFKQLFVARLPEKPYCANDLDSGLSIRNKENAMNHSNIQTNSPYVISCLLFDLDYAGAAFKWEEANLPPPSWISINPQNKHAHLAYMLKTPVYKGDNTSSKAITYMTKIRMAFSAVLDADMNYRGVVTKNPFHDKWNNIIYGELYDLGELAEYVDISAIHQIPKTLLISGRNCQLFEALRIYAYRMKRTDPDNFTNEVLMKHAIMINTSFEMPLEYSEIKCIVKSIFKWTGKRFDPEKFSESQRQVRKIVAAKTRKNVLAAVGTPKEIATKLDISERTAYRYIEKKEKPKPWLDLGISRATWYRKHKYLETEL